MNWIKNIFSVTNRNEINEKVDSIIESVLKKIENSGVIDATGPYHRRLIYREITMYNDELEACIKLINEAINLKPSYGEPFGVRSQIYLLQLKLFDNNKARLISLAKKDLETALKIGAKNERNQALWKEYLTQL